MGTSIGNYGRAYYSDPKWRQKMKRIHQQEEIKDFFYNPQRVDKKN